MKLSMRDVGVMVIVATLSACAAKRPAPIFDARAPDAYRTAQPDMNSVPLPVSVPGQGLPPVDALKLHTIQKGDTLLSVALANGLDYRELAAWNNIENPNLIKLGETLRLTAPGGTNDVSAASPGLSGAPITTPLVITTVPTPVSPPPGNTDKFKTEPKVAKLPYTDAAYANALAEAAAVAGTVVTAPATIAPSLPPTVAAAPPASDDIDWAWPIQPVPRGRIVAVFTDANKGVDISGNKGTAVLASAPGKVVYSGAGLRGYGRLVIIKHNATWLSAYAHNEKILVSEGESVKKGQKIAEMGSSDADQVKLHFEIRKQGKPVDPMQFLPK